MKTRKLVAAVTLVAGLGGVAGMMAIPAVVSGSTATAGQPQPINKTIPTWGLPIPGRP